jgi:thiamine kinase-like enzyme
LADPYELVLQAMKKDLQGLVFTEHGYQRSKEELEEFRRKNSIDEHFLLFSAQEVNTDFGHIIIFGADKSLDGQYRLSDLRRQYPCAAFVWAHPFRKGKIPSDEKLLSKDIDAVEIFSLNHTLKENYLGLKFWHRLKFTAVCGSDAHSVDRAGAFPTLFDHPVSTIGDIASEIKNGRCRPFYKEILLSGSHSTVTEVVIGTKGNPERRARIVIKQSGDEKTWNLSKRTALAVKNALEAVFDDKNYRTPKIYEIDDENRIIMEEGQRGQQLSKLLPRVGQTAQKQYFELAGKWLSKLHSYAIDGQISDIEESETRRLKRYKKVFSGGNAKFSEFLLNLTEKIAQKEQDVYLKKKEKFVFLHGDYHPGNIIVGQDDSKDPNSIFVSVIDFNNSVNYVKEFDIGYFLAQYQSQFSNERAILANLNQELFLKAYFGNRQPSAQEISDIMFFKLRAYLSIASFFHSLGMGESAQMEFVVSDINKTLEENKIL